MCLGFFKFFFPLKLHAVKNWLLLKAGTGNITGESWGMPGNHEESRECRGIMGNSEEYARNSGESRGMSRNIGE